MSKLVPIVAALAVASGCGVVKIKGLPGGGDKSSKSSKTSKTSETSEASAPSTSEPGKQAAAPSSTPTKGKPATKPAPVAAPSVRVKLTPGFSPNPKLVGVSDTSSLRADRDLGVKNCSGYVGASPIIVNATGDFEKLLITSETYVDFIVVTTSKGAYYCDQPSTTSKLPTIRFDVPAGEYKIYVGTRSNKRPIKATLRIEDLTAPATLAWLDDPRPSIKLDGNPTAFELRQRRFSKTSAKNRAEKHGPRHCNTGPSLRYPASPDLAITVTKRSTFTIGVRGSATGLMQVIGPLTADKRDIPQQCLPTWDRKLTLEPGRYFVSLGVKRGHAPTFANYYVKPVEAVLPPLTRIETDAPTAPLAITERALIHHYPALDSKRIYLDDELRRKLFLETPTHLFVSTRVDLDKHTAKAQVVVTHYSGSDKFLDPEAPFVFPAANEPLLLVNEGGLVLAADGSMYSVKLADLQPLEASTELSWPTTARNPHLYFQHAIKMAGADDAKRISKRDARWKKFAKCRDRQWDKAGPRLRRLNDYPHFNRNKIARLRRQTEGKVYKTCKRKALDASEKVIWKQLEASRTARRAAALAEIRQRFATLSK